MIWKYSVGLTPGRTMPWSAISVVNSLRREVVRYACRRLSSFQPAWGRFHMYRTVS